MNLYTFIFSPKCQVKRHIIFWTCWCCYFAFAFLIPTYWVPAWNLEGPMPQIEKFGVGISILRILMNSVLMTVVHMVIVYGFIYFFERYFPGRNKPLIIAVFLISFFLIVASFNYLNFLMTFAMSTRMGGFKEMPNKNFIIPIWIRQIIFNYPAVLAFALGFKLLKKWYLKQKETEQLFKEKINAEIQFLKAKVHPHFLFNTLNNIYSFILKGSDKAPEMILKLSGLLKYILNDCSKALVPLDKEIDMIQNYIALEQIRYGDKLNLSSHIQGSGKDKMISPLLMLPFVENSFKHGSSKMLTHPWVRMDISINPHFIDFKLSNNTPGNYGSSPLKKGIGLANVKKRLSLLYPDSHSLIINETEMSFDVEMRVALHERESSTENQENPNVQVYELA